jgi:gliding motility-associated-like protein
MHAVLKLNRLSPFLQSVKMILTLAAATLLTLHSAAGNHFILTAAVPVSNDVRMAATPDNGWVVFCPDSFRLLKFDRCGQLQWGRTYQLDLSGWNANGFTALASGGFAFCTRTGTAAVHPALVTRLDAQGAIAWTLNITDPQYDIFPYSLIEDSQGSLFVFANVSHVSTSPNYNMLCKISASGTLLWTKFYDHGGIWGGAIVTGDNGILARTGSTFIRTDNNGNVLWTSIVSSPSTYYYLAPVETNDGYVFTTYQSGGGGYINFHKINKQGQLLWGGYKQSTWSGNPPRLLPLANGHFLFAAGNDITETDGDLNVVAQNTLLPGVSRRATDACILNDGSPAAAGTGSGDLFVARLDNSYRSGCDAVPPPPVYSLLPVTQSFIATQATTHGMITGTGTVTAVAYSPPQDTVCLVAPRLELGPDTSVCTGTTLTLGNRFSDTFDTYQWSTGATTPSITVTQPGVYTVTVSNVCGSTLSDTLRLSWLPSATADLGPDRFLCEDSVLLLTAASCAGCTYAWSTGSTASAITLDSAGAYWLSILSPDGCSSSDTLLVTAAKCRCSVFLPSAFTPNHDGRNDRYLPVSDCDMTGYRFDIFDRWGQPVFRSQTPGEAWDGASSGTRAAPGVYVYRLEYTPLVGGTAEESVVRIGRVTVYY